jgi:inosine/xanthosine triphosphate pyrophosphatase family protein/cytidylate kinase
MLDIYFLTSNRAKFDHIKYLLRDHAINVKPQLDYGKAYTEPRIFNRDKLLEASIRDANTRLAKKLKNKLKNKPHNIPKDADPLNIDDLALMNQEKLFIIEDTSVRIDVLSQQTEFPGVDVKYWMKDLDFETLDKQLITLGNNRGVTVRSDIVIYLPPSFRGNRDTAFFKVFTGVTYGQIVDTERQFETNRVYPWLDNKTFNKWFSPEDEILPLSELSIGIANQYDFRKKAIDQLISYLQTNTLSYLTKLPPYRTPFQTGLFDHSSLIICGPTCSGKTMLANYLAERFYHYHIEASDFMHLCYYRKHGFSSSISIHDFALTALEENPFIVSEQIQSHLELINNAPCIITGFRSPKELDIFKNTAQTFEYIFVSASFNTRYDRSINRARDGHAKSLTEFRNQDSKQKQMGLDKIKSIEKFTKVINESSKDNYLNEILNIFFENSESTKNEARDILSHLNGSNLSLEESILISLLLENQKNTDFFTTTEIAKLINNSLSTYRNHKNATIDTSKNNVSRYFNQHLYPYYESKYASKTVKFRLSTTGVSHAKHILRQIGSRSSTLNHGLK